MTGDVQLHEYQDTYRLEPGILLIVQKYRTIGHLSLKKAEIQAKRGVSGLGVLKVDKRDWRDNLFKAGTLVIGYCAIEPVTDPKAYRVQIKMSGGTFEGAIADWDRFRDRIDEILNTYRL